MNIEPSLIIWTVVCFILLYFILKYLLFKPLLKVMDERKQKIGQAKGQREETEKRLDAQKKAIQCAREEAEKKKREEEQRQIEALRGEGKKQMEEAKRERIEIVEHFRRQNEAQYEQDLEQVRDVADAAAERFLQRLLS